MSTTTTCRRCGAARWSGLAPVCANCRDGYAEDVRQAAVDLTTAYLEDPDVTLDDLKPHVLTLIETLDGVADVRALSAPTGQEDQQP